MATSPNTRQTNIPGLDIPTHDYVSVAYVGVTNNIDTVTYKVGGSGGTTVATVTFTYAGGVPAIDDALVETVSVSKP